VAVYITESPRQDGLDEAVILTDTGNPGLTVMMITLEVAGLPIAQDIPEVITQVIWSPLTGIYVKTEVVPIFDPFTFH
jgi:hypothetical protein